MAYISWRGDEGLKASVKDALPPDLDCESVESRRFPGGIAAYYSFPDDLYEMFLKESGREAAIRLMKALNTQAPVVIRANLLQTTRQKLKKKLEDEGIVAQETHFSPYGLILPHRMNFESLACFKQGWFEVQDEASQLATMMVGARPGETILDACAGGGGKSLLMAMQMNDKGRIVAYDPSEVKLRNLKKRAERAGVRCINIISQRNEGKLEGYRGRCDAVLIDAPCSGTGTLRRNPDLKWRMMKSERKRFASLQLALLEKYAEWLKPGGRLIYVTCSVLKCENKDVVDAFIAKSNFEIVKIKQDHSFISEEGFLKILPCETDMDGFFACVLAG